MITINPPFDFILLNQNLEMRKRRPKDVREDGSVLDHSFGFWGFVERKSKREKREEKE